MRINEELVNSFAEQTNMSVFKNSYEISSEIISKAMSVILNRSALIKNYEIMVANEVFSGTEFSNSNLDLFLVLDAKQLEINNKQSKKGWSFKQNFKLFWKEFLLNFKLFNKKNKKTTEKKLNKQEKKIISTSVYTLKTFYKDFQIQLCRLLPKTSKTYISKNCLTIIDSEQIGIKINIYPVFKDQSNDGINLILYNNSNKLYNVINFGNRADCIDYINTTTKSLFKLQVRIFNSLFYNIMNYNPNQIFIESLLYNIPKDFYTYNIYETTKIIVNYLQNIDIKKFVSICNYTTDLFDEELNTVNFETAYKFIKSIILE